MISFKKITNDQFKACCNLSPGKDNQSYVAPNVVSLAQAYIALTNNKCRPIPYVIYKEETLVGFIMLAYITKEQDKELDENIYEIWRFMIDEKYQGNGYGRQALVKAIDIIKSFPYGEAKHICLSYVPENKIGGSLYESLGFKATGRVEDGEIVMAYDL